MIKELDKAYEPQNFEKDIYIFWEKGEYFRPEKQIELGITNEKSPRYCLTLPPPNVTGVLHSGHAITVAIEDLMIRYERMKQKNTLFLPGSDHAGIATQNVVERELLKQGIKRKEIGREKFVEKVWEWKHKYHNRITEQSKRLGMSSDWSRERFTLDENLSKAVRTAFIRLYEKNLIYRGSYLVNWCPGRCESAISDLEAESESIKSSLWYIRYPIITDVWKKPQGEWGSGSWAKNATEYIEVATTRPETLLGDTAVATTMNHKKFGHLIGKQAILPVNNRVLPIISDPQVDPKFGTGAVKITPAHDPNDYEIAQRQNLDFITIMDEKGRMIPEFSGKYAKMDRFDTRKKIVQDLKKEGLLLQVEAYDHSIAHCQRCNTIVEPRISTQWFVKTKPLAKKATRKVRSGETVIIPEREEKRFYQWMENIRDWCISRQLWWGHRIPVWYCQNGHQTCATEEQNPTRCKKCGDEDITQDPDVLDTWFSSGLWPFSTLGWPDIENPDYLRYYSTDMRETGYDILFFWVAREMMLGIELTGKTPYHKVYLHGIVRDEHGKKISKSMENIDQYDPLLIIKDFGADSLRYTLVANSVAGLDMNLDIRQLDAAHKFCNKIWQSTKFVLGNINKEDKISQFNREDFGQILSYADRWILSRLNRLILNVNSSMEAHSYLKTAREIKNFYWNEFCDWYLESTKFRLYNENEKDKFIPKTILLHILDTSLRLLHPFIPHITEKLWQALPNSIKKYDALIVSPWPISDNKLINDKVENEFFITIDIIREIRRIRKDFDIKINKPVPLILNPGNMLELFQATQNEIITLGKVDINNFTIESTENPPKRSARIMQHDITGFIPLEGLIDVKVVQNRIEKQLSRVQSQIHSLSKKLSSQFSQRAKPEIVEKEKEKLELLNRTMAQLEEQLAIVK